MPIKRENSTVDKMLKFGVVESYKAIRANLNFAVHDKGCKKIMFCSADQGDGKTTVCTNLAITIAQSGARIILLDCDLRRPRIHRMLGITNELGMSNALSNMCSVEDVILESGKPNLWTITAGNIPPNPGELLASENMKNILDYLENEFDYVFIDTPPVNVISDALPVSKLCGGVVLVVRCNKTVHPELKAAISKFEFAGANIAGIVLNGVKIKHSGSHYKYGYGKYSGYYKDYKEYSENEEEQ